MEMGFSQKKKHTGLGLASLILAIITIVLIVLIFVIAFVINNFTFIFVIAILGFIGFILALLALIFGAIAFFGRYKDKFGLIGFILGIVFLVLSLITPSLATYLVVIDELTPPDYEFTPNISVIVQDHPDTVNGEGDNLFTITQVAGDTLSWSLCRVKIYDNNMDDITLQTNAYYLSGISTVGEATTIKEDYYSNPVSSATTLTVNIIYEPLDTLIFSGKINVE